MIFWTEGRLPPSRSTPEPEAALGSHLQDSGQDLDVQAGVPVCAHEALPGAEWRRVGEEGWSVEAKDSGRIRKSDLALQVVAKSCLSGRAVGTSFIYMVS